MIRRDRLLESAEEFERLGAMERIVRGGGDGVLVSMLLDELLRAGDRLLREHQRGEPADEDHGDDDDDQLQHRAECINKKAAEDGGLASMSWGVTPLSSRRAR